MFSVAILYIGGPNAYRMIGSRRWQLLSRRKMSIQLLNRGRATRLSLLVYVWACFASKAQLCRNVENRGLLIVQCACEIPCAFIVVVARVDLQKLDLKVWRRGKQRIRDVEWMETDPCNFELHKGPGTQEGTADVTIMRRSSRYLAANNLPICTAAHRHIQLD